MKHTLILFLFLSLFGCSNNKNPDLQQDPTVTEHFNKSEISGLEHILTFFDNQVQSLSQTSDTLGHSYRVFFKMVKDSAFAGKPYGVILRIPGKKLNNLLSSLPDTLKHELWVTSRYISPMTKDSVADCDIKTGGKYEAFLKSSSKENKALAQYYKIFKMGNGITPSLIADLIMHSYQLNMKRQSQRLIVAVHYLALRKTGELRRRLMEKQERHANNPASKASPKHGI